jgi:hypothetical protein
VGIADAGVLAPHVIAAADADLKRAAADGVLRLLNVKGPVAPPDRAAA